MSGLEHMMNRGALLANEAMDRRRTIDAAKTTNEKLDVVISLLNELIDLQNNKSVEPTASRKRLKP